MKNESIVIEERFHGPPGSGNGGYVCGKLAGFLDTECAVRLSQPPPLDQELQVLVVDGADGDGVDLVGAGGVIAQARPYSVELDVPKAPDLSTAELASQSFVGFEHHLFPTCFVCGTDRAPGEGLRIFAGAVSGNDLVAAVWTPDRSLA
jgi:hypothetical protein